MHQRHRFKANHIPCLETTPYMIRICYLTRFASLTMITTLAIRVSYGVKSSCNYIPGILRNLEESLMNWMWHLGKLELMKKRISSMKEYWLVRGFYRKTTNRFWSSSPREVFHQLRDAEYTRRFYTQKLLKRKLIILLRSMISLTNGSQQSMMSLWLIFCIYATTINTSSSRIWSSSA